MIIKILTSAHSWCHAWPVFNTPVLNLEAALKKKRFAVRY